MKKVITPITIFLLILLTITLVRSFGLESEPESSKGVISQEGYIERMRVCTNGDFTGNNIFSKKVLDCLSSEIFKPLITREDFKMLNNVVHEAELRYPEFYLPCHNLMHTIVKYLPQDSEKLVNILKEIEQPSCQGGLVHGIFDAVAALKVTPKVLGDFAIVCTQKQDLFLKNQDQAFGSLSAYCSDASGHAAYALTNDLEEAVKICDDILNYGNQVSTCVEGVIMQRYEPVSGVGGLGFRRAGIELPGFCDTLKGKYETDDVFLGCQDGAAYVYMRKAYYIQNCPQGISCSEEEILSKIKSVVSEVYQLCKEHHDEALQNRCSDRMTLLLPGLVYSKDSYRERVCGIFSDPKQELICNQQRKDEMNRVRNGFA